MPLENLISIIVSLITAAIWLYKLYSTLKEKHRKNLEVVDIGKKLAKETISAATTQEKRSDINLFLILEHINHSERRVKEQVNQNSLFNIFLIMSLTFLIVITFFEVSITGVWIYLLSVTSATAVISIFFYIYYGHLLSKSEKFWKEGVYTELEARIESHIPNRTPQP